MGTLLAIVGFGWAALGLANLIGMFTKIGANQTGIATLGLMINVLLFVLPGLIVGGIGLMLRRRRHANAAVPVPDVERISCPNCGEKIPLVARTCRFCGHALTVAQP